MSDRESGWLPAPEGMQLDLLSAVERLTQVRDQGWENIGVIADRLFTCDLPRLAAYLTPETLAWRERIRQEEDQ